MRKTKTTNDDNGAVPRHLDDADLISYLDGELTRSEQEHARMHLESCWHCRSGLLSVQNSIESFLRIRKQILPGEVPPTGLAVLQFRRRLAQHSNVPVSLRRRLPQWLKASTWNELLPDFGVLLTHKKSALATVLVGLALIVFLIGPFNWNKVSADELLARASAYESLRELPAGKVVRARVRIDRIALSTMTERKIGDVETTRDSLTSGIYISAELASGINRKETLPDRDKLSGVSLLANDIGSQTARYLEAQSWFPQVSVSAYRELIAGRGLSGSNGAFVAHHGDIYELHHPFAPAHSSGITETVLLLNAQNYAPQRVSIFTAEGNEQFEYRMTRTSFESLERTPEVAKLFVAPAAEAGVATMPETVFPKSSEKRPEESSPPTAPTRAVATAELEVKVLGLLNQIGADLGQEVIVTRVPGAVLKIEAVVDTDKRKHEIVAALAPVAKDPAVNIQIETSAEVQQRALRVRSSRGETGPATVTTESLTNNSIPVQVQVRQYLLARGSSEQQVDTEVGRVANQIVMRSHRAMLHVWALKGLVQRFSGEDLRTLDPEASANWLRLIATHAREFQKEASALRQELAPIFNAGIQGGSQDPGEIADDVHLIQAVNALFGRASANHEVIRSAFTISTGSRSTSAITTPQFWHSLSQAESTAASIQSATKRLK